MQGVGGVIEDRVICNSTFPQVLRACMSRKHEIGYQKARGQRMTTLVSTFFVSREGVGSQIVFENVADLAQTRKQNFGHRRVPRDYYVLKVRGGEMTFSLFRDHPQFYPLVPQTISKVQSEKQARSERCAGVKNVWTSLRHSCELIF